MLESGTIERSFRTVGKRRLEEGFATSASLDVFSQRGSRFRSWLQLITQCNRLKALQASH